MPEASSPSRPDPDAVALRAMLYAGGELDGTDEQAFEELLGRDQSARDALCRAVQLSALLTDAGGARPDRAYRGRVRAKLLRPVKAWWARRLLAGVPVGAAAAVLLLALTPHAGPPAADPPPEERAADTAALPAGERPAVADDD